MKKHILKIESQEGRIFDTSSECVKYERIYSQIINLLSDLFDYKDDSLDFANGRGYIQHPPGTRYKLEVELVKLTNEYLEENFTLGQGMIHRYIDDCNHKLLKKLSYKITCMDKRDREYGQPYFAINPDKCVDIKLN